MTPETIARVLQEHRNSQTHKPTYCCPEDESFYDRQLVKMLIDAFTNEAFVEACFKCGWLGTTGPHTTCSRKPVRLYSACGPEVKNAA